LLSEEKVAVEDMRMRKNTFAKTIAAVTP